MRGYHLAAVLLPDGRVLIDGGQRSIQLPIGHVFSNDSGQYLSVVGSPTDSHVAPPGFYWLYLLDANRIPSQARLIQIT